MADVSDREEVCPVTFEPLAAAGPNQPVFLPACGHTFSRIAVQNILYVRHSRSMDAVVRCPLCATVQPRTLRMDNLVPNWDTIRRVEQLNTAKAAAEVAAQEAAAREAAAKETAAREAASRAAATASSLGISEFDSDEDLAHHGGTPLDQLQKLLDLKLFKPPPTLQNSDLQQLCANASSATPGSTLDMSGRELPFSTVSNWITAAFLSNHHLVDARIHPQLTLLDASTDEWAWDLAVPLDKLHLWTLSAEDVSICNAHIKLPSDGVLLLQAQNNLTFYNLTLEGGTVVCTSAGTKAIFESVQIVGATIVVTGGASAIISRCTILDCPVAVLVHGARSNALVRRSSARGCAAFVVATGGGTVQVKDSTVQMSDCGAAAVDVRGAGSHFQAADSTMSAPGQPSVGGDAADAAGLVGRGIRGRNGATIELVKYHVSGFMTGMDVCGAGTVIEARECNVHENTCAAIVVGQGAAAEFVGCSGGRGGSQALVVRNLGTSVRADRCGFGGTTSDAVVATDGAGIRMQECNLAHVLEGRALAVSGTSSRVKCMKCVVDDNKGGGVDVSAHGSCVLTDCKMLRCTGTAVAVGGAGSHAALDSCQVDDSASDGLRSTDGGVMTALKCTVRQSGGSALSVSGEQARIDATECLISTSVLHCVCINSGGAGVLQACEVGPSATGAGVHVQGAGSHADLQSTNVDSGDGTVVAMGGATAEVTKCHLESGVRAGGAATRLCLRESVVQGVSVVKAQAVLEAQTCNFSVKPQQVPQEAAHGLHEGSVEAEGTVHLSGDSTWQVEPLRHDELRMYIQDPEWNGVAERAAVRSAVSETADVRVAAGELAGLRERFWDGNAPRPSAEDAEAYHRAVHDDLFSSQDSMDAPPVDAVAYIGASAGGGGATGASSGQNSTDASRSRTFWQQSSSGSNRFAALVGAALGGPRPRPAASAAASSSAGPSSSTHVAAASAPHSSARQRPAVASASASTSSTPSRAADVPSVNADAAAASLLAPAAGGVAPARGPVASSAAHVPMQPLRDTAAQGSARRHTLAPATGAPQQRQQRMPQLLTNYDSGAQPSTEGSTSATSTLNAPVHGGLQPPEDLADILGREPSRSSTQMSADAAQAETTLSPHMLSRPATRERDRSSREHREHGAAGHYGDAGAGAPQSAAQHARRGASSRRNHTSPQTAPDAERDLLPRHASPTVPSQPRSVACATSSGSAHPPSGTAGPSARGVQEDFLNMLDAGAASSASRVQEHGRTQSSVLTHLSHSARAHAHTAAGSTEAGAAAATANATTSCTAHSADNTAHGSVMQRSHRGQSDSAFHWLVRSGLSRNRTPHPAVNQVHATSQPSTSGSTTGAHTGVGADVSRSFQGPPHMHGPPVPDARAAHTSRAQHDSHAYAGPDASMQQPGAEMAAPGPARAAHSDRSAGDRGEGSRRSGIMGAAAAMRSRLRRGRSGREA